MNTSYMNVVRDRKKVEKLMEGLYQAVDADGCMMMMMMTKLSTKFMIVGMILLR